MLFRQFVYKLLYLLFLENVILLPDLEMLHAEMLHAT
jgi:hypothetical protein